MYAAYLDESYDSNNAGFYVVAAVFGDGWDVLKGEKQWRKLLDKHRLAVYKSSKMSSRPAVVSEFAAVIRDSGLFAFGNIASNSDVRMHLDGSAFHKQYRESPHLLLYHLSFVHIALRLREFRAADYVSFVCDDSARYLGIMSRSYPQLKELNRESAPYMGSCRMENDARCIPLQMADLVASEIRRAAPTWKTKDTRFSDALHLLLESEVLCSVKVFDDASLREVRQLVDVKKHAEKKRRQQARRPTSHF
jgi:hypothetical protein